MNRFCAIFMHQIILQHSPEPSPVATFTCRRTIVPSLVDAIFPVAMPFDRLTQIDGRRKATVNQLCTAHAEQRKPILLGRNPMEDMGHRLIDYPMESSLTKIIIQFQKELLDLLCCRIFLHHHAAISQSAMGTKDITFGIGWQQGIEHTITIKHQGIILEPVAVIVHILTIEEERAVLRLRHELIPLVSLLRSISNNVEHLFVSTFI